MHFGGRAASPQYAIRGRRCIQKSERLAEPKAKAGVNNVVPSTGATGMVRFETSRLSTRTFPAMKTSRCWWRGVTAKSGNNSSGQRKSTVGMLASPLGGLCARSYRLRNCTLFPVPFWIHIGEPIAFEYARLIGPANCMVGACQCCDVLPRQCIHLRGEHSRPWIAHEHQ